MTLRAIPTKPLSLILAVALATGAAPTSLEAATVVAAANNLQSVLPELAAAFEESGESELRLVFGASGNLTRQIREGAPFELFLSADQGYVAVLAAEGLTRDEGVDYARGRLVLFVAEGSPLKADGSFDDLAAALGDGRLARFAIANPEHAPYGRAAEEALRHRGLWEAIGPHLVFGENVAQAVQFAASGNADGGLVALSLVLAPQVAARGQYVPVPGDWYTPLDQRMVLLAGAGAEAEAFYDFLQTPGATAIFARHGFDTAGAAP